VQLAGLRLQSGASVSEGEVRSYLDANADQYRAAPKYRFEQVYLNTDRHPRDLDKAARQLGLQLKRNASTHADGDPFLLGNTQGPASVSLIAARFGDAFAQAITKAPRDKWVGPLRSPYGLHFVRVQKEEGAMGAEDARALSAARWALIEERRQQALRAGLAKLRSRYLFELESASIELGAAQ
jgi:hypothetical protein